MTGSFWRPPGETVSWPFPASSSLAWAPIAVLTAGSMAPLVCFHLPPPPLTPLLPVPPCVKPLEITLDPLLEILDFTAPANVLG